MRNEHSNYVTLQSDTVKRTWKSLTLLSVLKCTWIAKSVFIFFGKASNREFSSAKRTAPFNELFTFHSLSG